ncbi:MAG: thermonuclease family protein [Patescibacteria group bacterium]|nr:thermonuclease family protein [Patescibacteria group bacterium]
MFLKKYLKNNFKKILFYLFFILFLVSIFFNFIFYKKIKEKNLDIVTEVVDGDTIIINNNQTIRLSNLYAPEIDYCAGNLAKKRLEELVFKKRIKIETVGKDSFKRTLGLVYYQEKLINEILLKEGLARYDGSPSPKRDILKKVYDEAFKNKKGIFSLCVSQNPPNKNCLIKGNIDRHYPQKKRYFLPSCHEYKQVIVEKDLGEEWFCDEKEAQKKGFIKAQNCP